MNRIYILLFTFGLLYLSSWVWTSKENKHWDYFVSKEVVAEEPKTSTDSLPDLQIQEAIAGERASVEEDLASYPEKVESAGRPVQSMIVATWRSGSSFLGEVLNSHPVSTYHYEPLHLHGITQLRGGPLAKEAVRSLAQLLTCNYTGMEDYMGYNKGNMGYNKGYYCFAQNKRMWGHCLAGGKEAIAKSYCWNTEFATHFCKLFPFHSIKTVRLRLNMTETLVTDERLSVKIMLLVRDPRGTVNSRKTRSWCKGYPDCADPARLCKDMEDDFHAFKDLSKRYPSRYKVVRYEDFSLDPEKHSKDVLQFYGVPFHPNVEKYLQSHTTKGNGNTGHDSKKTPFLWRHQLNKTEIIKIQEGCETALSLWGYNLYRGTGSLKTFDPLM